MFKLKDTSYILKNNCFKLAPVKQLLGNYPKIAVIKLFA